MKFESFVWICCEARHHSASCASDSFSSNLWQYCRVICNADTCAIHIWKCVMTIFFFTYNTWGLQYFIMSWLFHAFCLHINSGCLSSLWPTHSSQDKEQSTTKLVLLQKAKTMGITRPPCSVAKQVSRARRQKVRNYGRLENNKPFILSYLCL